ncbi:hypothetical protein Lgra_0289 [Legionella gratiana]|uniref:Uncharacterized protein n=1 Tax=Legionella gratiana TaxID=45066 RepID=A0A378JBI8_9GAMM|nr:hypothetical protein [Legionella gratiana]KTD15623.1 hypothetical protein Lgra_0289 [Legionella gratiana]STX44955.1 Uncharacterised protein [Legionella gratiana]
MPKNNASKPGFTYIKSKFNTLKNSLKKNQDALETLKSKKEIIKNNLKDDLWDLDTVSALPKKKKMKKVEQ